MLLALYAHGQRHLPGWCSFTFSALSKRWAAAVHRLHGPESQTWILYASEPIALKMGPASSKGATLTATAFTGVMRVALAPSAAATTALDR